MLLDPICGDFFDLDEIIKKCKLIDKQDKRIKNIRKSKFADNKVMLTDWTLS